MRAVPPVHAQIPSYKRIFEVQPSSASYAPAQNIGAHLQHASLHMSNFTNENGIRLEQSP